MRVVFSGLAGPSFRQAHHDTHDSIHSLQHISGSAVNYDVRPECVRYHRFDRAECSASQPVARPLAPPPPCSAPPALLSDVAARGGSATYISRRWQQLPSETGAVTPCHHCDLCCRCYCWRCWSPVRCSSPAAVPGLRSYGSSSCSATSVTGSAMPATSRSSSGVAAAAELSILTPGVAGSE